MHLIRYSVYMHYVTPVINSNCMAKSKMFHIVRMFGENFRIQIVEILRFYKSGLLV